MSFSKDPHTLELTVQDDAPTLPFFLRRFFMFDLHLLGHWRRLWQNRYLLYALTIRGIRARYKQSMLGVGWALLTPAAMTLVFTYVFTRAGLTSKVGYPCPVPLYILCMMTFWNYFQRGITNGSTSLVSNMDLVTKVYFPREVLPIASVCMNLVDWMLAFSMFVLVALLGPILAPPLKEFVPNWAQHFMTGWTFAPHLRWLWTPVFLLLMSLFVLGLVFIASTLQVYFRDISHLINLGLFLWLFVTPVLYPLDALAGGRATSIIIVNPITGLLDGLQLSLLGHQFPWENHVLYAAAFSVALFLVGYSFFKHEERYFADVV